MLVTVHRIRSPSEFTNLTFFKTEPNSGCLMRLWVHYLLVGFDDVLDLFIDEVVERIDVLPHQTLDLQESRHQLPLVLDFFDGLAHLGRVYARLP